ncbi:hypothetical protein K435DRAFT_222956 [Dendrothele bispora CBS 962.96]|uniref:Uncharacterized protein n=1 Tax=Dendrothele bispora (strain CBS 962.96) TaxID=1314807 RepID=A0A4S8LSC7_DENBC|nr:hypothetical protein K435DRAFT_222956 [Dendrothele bispora CBS 962.96]
MLFSLVGAIISPKFFRKLATLSELAYHVPLNQIDIPPAVYQENLKHVLVSLPDMHYSTSSSAAFGVPLGHGPPRRKRSRSPRRQRLYPIPSRFRSQRRRLISPFTVFSTSTRCSRSLRPKP